MRIGILSDIHGNLEALDAVLADVADVGVDRIVCLGDVVGYGADPHAAIERVAELVGKGALCVKGNHDDAVEHGWGGMSDNAARALAWTKSLLDAEEERFLAGLPLAAELGDVLFVHASAAAPEDWTYMETAAEAEQCFSATCARRVFCGHTHVPMLFAQRDTAPRIPGRIRMLEPAQNVTHPLAPGHRTIAIIGAVGQPRDGDPRACWGLYDSEEDALRWCRVAYDIGAAARKISAAGLPGRLARRLFEGR